jgi:hypothetical protein
VADKLIFSTDLQIVSGFELAVLHVVVFHAHKGGAGIGFGTGVAIAQRFKLFLIRFEFGLLLF